MARAPPHTHLHTDYRVERPGFTPLSPGRVQQLLTAVSADGNVLAPKAILLPECP